jgi:hypothetical protein
MMEEILGMTQNEVWSSLGKGVGRALLCVSRRAFSVEDCKVVTVLGDVNASGSIYFGESCTH